MILTVPTATAYEIKRRHRGTKVFAVQRALNSVGFELEEDAVFGRYTETAVKSYQESAELKSDGVVGSGTQAALADSLAHGVDPELAPALLLKGAIEGESGNKIAAVNTSVPGGTDCGYVQRRVYTADFAKQSVIKRAFDSAYQIDLLAKTLRARHDAYLGKGNVKTEELAWRLAMMYHNYPVGADKLASGDTLTSYWTTPQTWVMNVGAHFPDGDPVQTPLDWCQHYALGAPAHQDPGTMTKYLYPL